MKLLAAFLKLVRWPNLVFIALTQILFYFCIVLPEINKNGLQSNLSYGHFALLVLSYVFIAAGGNIINDYFDLNIDLINKPQKVVVNQIIKRRWVIVWHIVLSVAAVMMGFYIDGSTPVRMLGIANLVCVVLLFIYSISLKKKLLVGNVIIALLIAWSLLVVTFCETTLIIRSDSPDFVLKITRLSILYAAFAYIITLIREVIKDMEDIEGDRRFGCTTMPIVWGINATKIFTAVWIIILIVILVLVQFYVLQFGWWVSILYCVLLIIIPLIRVFKKLLKARSANDYSEISKLVKLIILSGILSMVFFKIYD